MNLRSVKGHKNSVIRHQDVILQFIVAAVFAVGMGFLVQYYVHLQEIMQVKEGSAIVKAAVRVVLANPYTYVTALVIFGVAAVLVLFPQVGERIYRFRYLLATILFIVCVAIGINGSSLGYWCELYGISDSGLLAGYSRIVRSDEFCVATPSFFAQYANGSADAYAYYSDVINGTVSDLYLGIRQPILHILTIFRPFLLGYLFLPAQNALSFFWCGKLLVCFSVSYEFGLLLTDGFVNRSGAGSVTKSRPRRDLALIYALLITFAPALQWWYTGAIIDLVIYTQGALMLFRKYLTEGKFFVRTLYVIAISYLAGAFLLCLYPAWQIPMGYVLVAFIVWLIVSNRKSCKLTRLDIIPIAVCAALLVWAGIYIYLHSADTFLAITGTVYPGEREELGGGESRMLFTYGVDFLFTLTNKGFGTNICQSATVVDFFPMCLVLPAVMIFYAKRGQKDFLMMGLLVLSVILTVWVCVGFPSILAKITLLSNSQPSRTKVVLGIVNTMLLVRSLSQFNLEAERCKAVQKKDMIRMHSIWKYRYYMVIVVAIGMIAACILAFGSTVGEYMEYLSVKQYLAMIVGIYLLLTLAYVLYVLGSRKHVLRLAGVLLTVWIAMLGGIMVNPIRIGAEAVEEIPWVAAIGEVTEENNHEGVWVIENSDAPAVPNSDIGLWVGAKTLNATAIYPNLTLWHILDPEGESEEVYNRYAHINVIVKEAGEAEFALDSEDTFTVRLTLSDLAKLGVDYITSRKDLSAYETKTDGVILQCIHSMDGIYIYKVQSDY